MNCQAGFLCLFTVLFAETWVTPPQSVIFVAVDTITIRLSSTLGAFVPICFKFIIVSAVVHLDPA